MSSRSGRVAAILVALFVLTAGRQVEDAPNAVLAPRPGERLLDLAEGDTVATYSLGYGLAARVGTPFSAQVGGKSESFAVGDVLTGVIVGGVKRDEFPGPEVAFCATPRKRVENMLAPPPEPAKVFGKHTRMCFIDRDTDGILDGAFLHGAKLPADKAIVDMPPQPVEMLRSVPMEAGEMRLGYSYSDLYSGANFKLDIRESGKKLSYDYILREAGGRIFSSADAVFVSIRKPLPYSFDIAGGRFTVLALDPKAKTARVRIDRHIPAGLYRARHLTVTYIYY
jgi:hypothetical protein